jgi:hypothetical protein
MTGRQRPREIAVGELATACVQPCARSRAESAEAFTIAAHRSVDLRRALALPVPFTVATL